MELQDAVGQLGREELPMTRIDLPAPVVRRPDQPRVDVAARQRELRERVDGEVRFDPGSRGAYGTDASNYRQGRPAGPRGLPVNGLVDGRDDRPSRGRASS